MKRDSQVFDLISEERNRQMHGIELIASENFVSDEVMEAMGSVLTNKYAEGYPAARYYGGCQVVDKVENLAIERVCKPPPPSKSVPIPTWSMPATLIMWSKCSAASQTDAAFGFLLI